MGKAKGNVHVQGLAVAQAQFEIALDVLGQLFRGIREIDAARLDEAGSDLHRDFVVAGLARNLGHFGQGEKPRLFYCS